MKILQSDFNMIKDTFYNGTPPLSKGVIKIEDRVASSQDDTTFEGTYTKKTSQTISIQQTPNGKGIDAQKKATQELAQKAADALKIETDALKTTQKTLQERVADAGSVSDYVRQTGGWDSYIRELNNQTK
jgi:FtsZ-binding cell division protein ZapB